MKNLNFYIRTVTSHHNFILGVFVLFFMPFSFGQLGENWDMQGNIADSTSFIGTKNNACLRFSSNDVERMRITSLGNVGIGIPNPTERLEVDGNILLSGDITFKGYQDIIDTTSRFLMVDRNGTTKPLNFNTLKGFFSIDDCYDILHDLNFPGIPWGGGTLNASTLSSWASRVENEKSILYTGTGCPTWVGIGTNSPKTRIDVIGDSRFTRGVRIGEDYQGDNAALYIENYYSHGNIPAFDHLVIIKDKEGKKILQLDEAGLLRSREVKVDLQNWPDYVFKEDYKLMPLREVKEFINEKGHLPNVPSAAEIEAEGVSLGEASKISMEKIEELTLYLLELDEKIEKQNELIEAQQKTIELQQQYNRQA